MNPRRYLDIRHSICAPPYCHGYNCGMSDELEHGDDEVVIQKALGWTWVTMAALLVVARIALTVLGK